MIKIENKLAYEYFQSVQDRFAVLCKPLLAIGIKDIFYFFLNTSGRYLLLTTSPHMAEHYFSNAEGQGDFFTHRLKTLGKNGKKFLAYGNVTQFDFANNPILYACWENDFWNAFIDYKKLDDYSTEGWGFSLGRNFNDPTNFFLDNFSLLDDFQTYFSIAGKDLIDIKNQKKLGFFNTTFQFCPPEIHEKKEALFFQRMHLDKINLTLNDTHVILTKRQSECLYYLTQSYSIKEIAKSMNISTRTVEDHLQIVKDKIGCCSKIKLLDYIQHSPDAINTLQLIKKVIL